jgi:hypothetical protein
MNSKTLFKTRTPNCYYVWLLLNAAFFIFLLWYNTIFPAVIGTIILGIFSYVSICRFACRVTLYNDRIVATYLFPYIKKVEVKFSGSDRIVYELGYYYYFSDEYSLSKIQYLHPHDTIYFYTSGSKQNLYDRISINANFFDFKKIRKYMETELNLIKVNSVY